MGLKEVICMLQDSGERTEFESGAIRDMSFGKGDMVAMPWKALLRLSKQYELGSKKYSRFNYQKGIPVSSFIDSACRHLAKYQCGCDDEDHLAAAAFNVLGAMLMEADHKELIDLELRQGKNTFDYFSNKPANDIAKLDNENTEAKKLFNPGSTFRLGGVDWLILNSTNSEVFCITKNCVDYMVYSEVGENTYDYSIIAQYLTKEFIPRLEKSIDFNRDFLISHKTNIAKLYDDFCPKYKYYSIRLLTYEEYLKYKEIVDLKYKNMWWLLTGDKNNKDMALAVDCDGTVYNKITDRDELGVRPVCVFDRLCLLE